jgi:hypothetical protein
MRRNLVYLVALALLVMLALLLLYERGPGAGDRESRDFAVSDTGSVLAVELTGGDHSLRISKENGAWKLNETSPARRESIRALLILVSRLEVLAPVSADQAGRVYAGLRESGLEVKVDAERGGSRRYRVFYDSISRATYMMSGDAAYRVRLRGSALPDLQSLFILDERYWRENLVFHLLPSEIHMVRLDNLAEKEKGFILLRNDKGMFEISRGSMPQDWVTAREESVRQYLGYFFDVRFRSYLDPGTDTLSHGESPDYVLTVADQGNVPVVLKLYRIYRKEGPGNPKPDPDRLYGRLNDEDEWVILSYLDAGLLLKDYEYFTGP